MAQRAVSAVTPESKATFIRRLEAGGSLYRSAADVGWTPAKLRAARKADAGFNQEVVDALEQASEPVEKVLYEAAQRGEPWAVQMFLKGRLRDRWSDAPVAVVVSGGIEIEAGNRLAGIALLQSELAARRLDLEGEASSQILDVVPRSSMAVAPISCPSEGETRADSVVTEGTV